MVPLKKGKEKRAQAARSIVTLQVYQISCETLILLSDCIARLKDFQIVLFGMEKFKVGKNGIKMETKLRWMTTVS